MKLSIVKIEGELADKIDGYARQMAAMHYQELVNDPRFVIVCSPDQIIEKTAQKYLKMFARYFGLILAKDIQGLESMLHPGNVRLREIFKLETGIDLGRTQQSARVSLIRWLSQENSNADTV